MVCARCSALRTCPSHDVDPHAMEKFRRNLEPLGFRIHPAKDVDEAVEGADIITTCTADKQQAKVRWTAR